MKNNISLLVGLKNNLDYNQHFYETTRELYPEVEICFVSYGSTDGTHEWLASLQDPNVKRFFSAENKTFSDTFNIAAQLATKDYVAYLHNDIVLAPGFIENLEKHVGPDKVVSYTTIEPPIFADHPRPGKLIYDLGASLDTFNKAGLHEYAAAQQTKYYNQTEPGITFFMCMPRLALLEIGGLDNLFNPMFCEDDDLIRRWELYGMQCVTALDAMCYHFVSKTSRFSDEYAKRTRLIEMASNRNFIRKWGTRGKAPKYNIAFVVQRCSQAMLEALEPLCDRIYVDNTDVIDAYIAQEQPNTRYNLKTRVLHTRSNVPTDENDIVVAFDATQLTKETWEHLHQLPEIIADSAEIGEFVLGQLKFSIYHLECYEKNLIKLNSQHIYS